MAFPVLRRIGGWLFSYARKATVNSAAGATVTTTLLQQIGVGEEAASGLIGTIAGLPWYVQFPVLLIGYFVLVYLPANGPKPAQ